ncbi:carboxypeptidase regulatory-like domain-containing protein [Aggregicoccus sp. 17bor-14]|uniref:carboxypeptidase-like regulatory domain-containing protein n=1 Tax=Myxococcaceae TaxID=31 RepID=UPI00129C7FD8|nr:MULTISPECIES: carboxypeptidase-like regulatory domain-containing protein [Myxococcaceae]MBF5045599.1 carboxypeptidase regulatory-like domain-containing protein [Simulacricoccus sp. 17bor-14]MRI91336.1 carboxypeptidase regulatory-like domain-containing protein [Aggregicoccus sp. 17bor-14]
MKRSLLPLLGAAALLAACGSDDPNCDPTDPKACDAALVCEQVSGLEAGKDFRCLAPVQVQGRVFDLASNAAVPNALVAAVDVNGAPVGTQTTTGADGSYTLRIPALRSDEAGTPVNQRISLRAAARDFAPFPSGLRVALPFDTSVAARPDAQDAQSPFVIHADVTDVGLVGLPQDQRGRPSISGHVDVGDTHGVLVVAEAGDALDQGHSGIADASGSFTLFNVPAGDYSVKAFGRGANWTPASVTVATADVANVQLQRSQTAPATLTGAVSFVGPGAGPATSVVMVVASTFDPVSGRGEVPPGLRAPEPGVVPNVTSAFTITGVPDGRYAVLAAFENDNNVRDPNPGTAGTDVQFVTVTNGQIAVAPSTFKVTSAITLVGPGAGEAVDAVGATPTFSWQAYPQTATYDVIVFDTLGNTVWEKTGLTAVTSGANSLVYAGPALTAGSLYQWRVTARRNGGDPISRSEDLKGLFRVQP